MATTLLTCLGLVVLCHGARPTKEDHHNIVPSSGAAIAASGHLVAQRHQSSLSQESAKADAATKSTSKDDPVAIVQDEGWEKPFANVKSWAGSVQKAANNVQSQVTGAVDTAQKYYKDSGGAAAVHDASKIPAGYMTAKKRARKYLEGDSDSEDPLGSVSEMGNDHYESPFRRNYELKDFLPDYHQRVLNKKEEAGKDHPYFAHFEDYYQGGLSGRSQPFVKANEEVKESASKTWDDMSHMGAIADNIKNHMKDVTDKAEEARNVVKAEASRAADMSRTAFNNHDAQVVEQAHDAAWNAESHLNEDQLLKEGERLIRDQGSQVDFFQAGHANQAGK